MMRWYTSYWRPRSQYQTKPNQNINEHRQYLDDSITVVLSATYPVITHHSVSYVRGSVSSSRQPVWKSIVRVLCPFDVWSCRNVSECAMESHVIKNENCHELTLRKTQTARCFSSVADLVMKKRSCPIPVMYTKDVGSQFSSQFSVFWSNDSWKWTNVQGTG